MYRQLCVLTGLVFLLTVAVASADDKKDLDEGLEAWVTAFNKHDAKALAKLYTEDADVMHSTGERFKGRAAIEKDFTDVFSKNPDIKTKAFDVSRKFLTPDIVVEDGKWEEWGYSEENLQPKGGYTTILVKQNGKWLVVHERGFVPVKKPDKQN